jgi:hypothetical protein
MNARSLDVTPNRGASGRLVFAGSVSAAGEKQVPLRLRRFGMTVRFF